MNRGNLIFLLLSLITIITGVAVFMESSAYKKKAKIAEGRVVRSIGSSYTITYLSDDGNEHSKRGSSGKTKKYHLGDKVKVFYLAANPDKARVTDGQKGGKTIVITGIAMLLFSLLMIFTEKSRKKSAGNFKTNGRKVQAEILGVETDNETTVMKKHPYLIRCRWTDPISGKEYNHVIKNIWKDPAPYLSGRTSMDVYIDRDDPGRYFLDTDFMKDILSY